MHAVLLHCRQFLRRLLPSPLLILRSAAIGLLLMFLAGLGLWQWMNAQHVPPEAVAAMRPAALFYDQRGELITVQRGSDYRWLFPVDLAQIPAELREAVIAVEDRNFYRHRGVDCTAMLRAAWQLLTFRRIVSGASTITMQVVNQYCGRGRGPVYKLRQMGRALNWERTHTKEQILTDYFNLLPYGGKIYGIEAAAHYYYGRSARELNRAEQLLLAGLPQSPNRFRPDRHPARAVWRRNVVLVILQRAGHLSAAEAEAIRALPLRFRDFALPPWPTQRENEFTALLTRQYRGRQIFHTTLDPLIQTALRTTLTAGRDALSGVYDGAGVVMETPTGKVRALIGDLPGGDRRCRQINAAAAWRSPGSLLKPFIYGEAVNGGLLCEDTILQDRPLHYRDYRPGNFDGQYRGEVTAGEALATSLNIPAIRLLEQLGPKRIIGLLHPLGLFPPGPPPDPRQTGLSLTLGSTSSQLLALAAAYSALGKIRPPRFLEDEPAPETQPYWLPGTVQLVHKMLRRLPLPGAAGLQVAWKTGTSNGNRDAWCISVTPQWTVAVWYGNKSGTPAPALVGGTAAAPVAGAMQRLLHGESPPQWPQDDLIALRPLCRRSGLTPGPFCTETTPGCTVAGLPLQRCNRCGRNALQENRKNTRILSPAPGEYIAGRNGEAHFVLKCTPTPATLYIDGRCCGSVDSGFPVRLTPGSHQLLLWGGDGYASDLIHLNVLPHRGF